MPSGHPEQVAFSWRLLVWRTSWKSSFFFPSLLNQIKFSSSPLFNFWRNLVALSQPLYCLKLREDEERFPPHCPYSQGNPSIVVFKSLPILKIPRGSRNSQSCDHRSFVKVDSPYMHFFSPQKHTRNARNIIRRQTRPMSRNNLRRITSEDLSFLASLVIKTYGNKPQNKTKNLWKWWNKTRYKKQSDQFM